MSDTQRELEARIELLGATPSTALVDLRNELAWELRYSDTPRAVLVSHETLTMATALDYPRGRAYALLAFGQCQVTLSKLSEGLAFLGEARRLFEKIGDQRGLGLAVNGLGIAEEHLGNFGQAIECYVLSHSIREQLGDALGAALSLNNIGAANFRLGNYAEALEHFYRCLVFAEQDDGWLLGIVSNNLGDIYLKLREYDLALEYLMRGLASFRQHGRRLNEGQALLNIGSAYRGLGDRDTARRYFYESLGTVRDAGSAEIEAEVLCELAEFDREIGEWTEAFDNSLRSLELARDVGSRLIEAEVLITMASVLEDRAEHDPARDALERALALAHELGSNELTYKAHFELARVLENAGRFAEALEQYKAFYREHELVLGEASARKIKALLMKQELDLTRREAETLRLKNDELSRALAEVKNLRGMLPICSYCKAIRNDENYWQKIESYLSEHTEALLSHGICPSCYDTIVAPEIERFKKAQSDT